MKKLTVIFMFIAGFTFGTFAQTNIIDHNNTELSQVPLEWINIAKADLRVWYGHTSHGSQITSGIQNLMNHLGEPYTFNNSGTGGAMSYQEQTGVDLGHNGDTSWANITRDVLNQPGNNRNVIMWSWCGGCSDNTEDGINLYLAAMTNLENEYPDVHFIYMTGHLDIWSWQNLKERNQQIRDYCNQNNKILFDFADIESYNPGQDFFEYAHDNCNYYDGPSGNLLGNWATEWCDENPDSELCWPCSCAHSEALNCNLKGRAFWWMMAQIAGWGGTSNIYQASSKHELVYVYPNPSSDHITLRINDKQSSKVELFIYNSSGGLVQSFENRRAGTAEISVNLKDLSGGFYYYQLITDKKTLKGKFSIGR